MKLKDDASKFIGAYKGLVSVSDEAGPSITGVTFDGGTAKVSFSEALKTVGTVSVNGVQQVAGTGYANFTAGGKELVLNNIEAGKSYNLTVVGAQDVAGNYATPNALSYTINAPVDNAKPTVAVSVSGTKVTFDFSEELKGSDLDGTAGDEFAKVTLGSGSAVYLTANEQDSNDKTKFVYDFNGSVSGDFLNSTLKVESFTDKAGLAGDTVTTAVSLQKDKTPPSFVSATTKDESLIVKFNEDVTASAVVAGDLSIKFVDSEGVLTPAATPNAIGAVASSYDANGNGVIDGDEESYVVIPLTGSQFVSGGKLKAGTYTVTLAAGEVSDTAAVANATTSATTFTVSVAADSASKAVVRLQSAVQQTAPGQILVTYNKEMGSSALVAANYKLGGVTLPTNTNLTFLGDKTKVLVTLPDGYVTANGNRVLEVANLSDKDGNTLESGYTSSVATAVLENVAPTASKVSLVDGQNLTVDFSEVLDTLPTVSGVKVKVNGSEIALDTTTPFALDSTGKVVTIKAAAATAFKLSDTITVEFSNTNIADLAGNKVKNVVLTK